MSTLSVVRQQRRPLAFVTLCLLAVVGACSRAEIKPDQPQPIAAHPTISYWKDVQPIFEDKCAACHACNDAPCQLKLTSSEGLDRGASKALVYDGTRLSNIFPTRLGIDALTTDEWREKGFYSVRFAPQGEETHFPAAASLLFQMVDLGHRHPWPANSRIPNDIPLGTKRTTQCPMLPEMADYIQSKPTQGMPLAATGLTDEQFDTIRRWVDEGSTIEPSPVRASGAELEQIHAWEQYLNRDGDRQKLVARYLYEHLFLAHLYFTNQSEPHYFELLRSSTPPGEPIQPIATAQPNEAPGRDHFYYRFRLIDETIVNKTHILYSLGEARMQRFDALFFKDAWNAGTLPGYEEANRANPFATFAAIPAKARYQFMLDNAEYFVRSFIRGPVCAGQIATDVIRDQFWTFFENPDTERYVNDAAYRQRVTPLIGVPGQETNLLSAGPEWEKYLYERNHYVRMREAEYAKSEPKGPILNDIWDGDGTNHDAALTIFRHFDNAAVIRGFIGQLPETLWWMDYPLLERSYYQLVVNFNVYGSIAHQLKTRLYFDLIRNEAENNFLRLLPKNSRKPLRDDWYAQAGKLKMFTTYENPKDNIGTRLKYQTSDAKAEAATQLLSRLAPIIAHPDDINRCDAGRCKSTATESASTTAEIKRALRMLAAGNGKTAPFITQLPEISFLRITLPNGGRTLFSLVHNRAHSNVAFMTGESLRLLPERDTLTVVTGPAGSYPNFIFDVPLAKLPQFVTSLRAADSTEGFENVAEQWGVRRTAPNFWTVFHDVTRIQMQTEPLEAGLFDMNRYENW